MIKKACRVCDKPLCLVPREDLNPHGVTRLILSQVRLPFRHPGISLVPGTLYFSAWHKKNYTITSRIVKYFFELFLT